MFATVAAELGTPALLARFGYRLVLAAGMVLLGAPALVLTMTSSLPAILGDAGAKAGQIASHRFLGGHTYLATMLGDADRLARNQAFLRGVATIDVPALRRAGGEWVFPAEGAEVRPGERFSMDVVVRSRQVGHAFPGGAVPGGAVPGGAVSSAAVSSDGSLSGATLANAR